MLWLFTNIALGVDNYLSTLSTSACLGLITGLACAMFQQTNAVIVGTLVPLQFNLVIALGSLFFHIEKDLAGYLAVLIITVVMSGIGAASGYSYKVVYRS
jgi:hypothetical protein